MRVACPDCETNFDIPAEKIVPGGQSVKCCRCGLTFGVKPRDMPKDSRGEEEKTRKSVGAFSTILLLVLVGMIAYVVVVKPSYMNLLSSEGIQKFKTFISGEEKSLPVSSPAGSYMNRHDGKKLFVMTGWVENTTAGVLDEVAVEGMIYGHGNALLDSNIAYCNNILSETDLKTLEESELRKRLSAAPENGKIAPGTKAPFIVVFTEPPAEIVEFNVLVKAPGS